MTEYGLIGFPLGHSFSKKFFTEKFASENLNATYQNFEIPDISMLYDIVRQHPNLKGLNCTIPYKEAILPYLDSISPEAQEIGAVNVIKIQWNESCKSCNTSPSEQASRPTTIHHRKGFCLIGHNSDITGFTDSIAPLLKSHHKKALILGTGGAAKAIRVGLRALGLESTYVSRRDREGQLTYDDITPEKLKEHQVVVNCSPVGMFPHTDEAPQLPYDALTPEHLLYDLIYNPEQTLFLQLGEQAGATTKNGLDMLRLQALASWDIWNQ